MCTGNKKKILWIRQFRTMKEEKKIIYYFTFYVTIIKIKVLSTKIQDRFTIQKQHYLAHELNIISSDIGK